MSNGSVLLPWFSFLLLELAQFVVKGRRSSGGNMLYIPNKS